MKAILTSCLISLFIIFISCGSKTEQTQNPKTIQSQRNNDSIAANLAGKYEGIMPCADCEYIRYSLLLQKDRNFQSQYIYSGKNVPPVDNNGKWSLIGDSILFLQSTGDVPAYMKIYHGDSLIMLDENKQRMNGPLPSMFNFKRVVTSVGRDTAKENSSGIPSAVMKLEELNGKKITENEFNKTPEIVIDAANSTAGGSTGCNRFNGNVKISKNNISFGEFAMTRMSCPGNGEQEFVAALKSSDAFRMENNKLFLMSNGKTVAVFVKK